MVPGPRLVGDRPEPPTGLREVTALLPVAPHREAQPDRGVRVGRRHGPVEDSPDVVVIAFEAPQPPPLIGAGQQRRRHLGERDERAGVAPLDLCPLADVVEVLGSELPDRVEHPEARRAIAVLGADEALVGQRHQAVEDLQARQLGGGPADLLGAVELAATDEHGEPASSRRSPAPSRS